MFLLMFFKRVTKGTVKAYFSLCGMCFRCCFGVRGVAENGRVLTCQRELFSKRKFTTLSTLQFNSVTRQGVMEVL